MTTRTITTDIDIDAPADAVWRVLADFERYGEWNPFVRRIEGRLEAGARLLVEVALPGRRPMRFRPRILDVEPGAAFRWLGHVGVPGLFDGEHAFRLGRLAAGGTRLVHEERFRGLLVPVLLPWLERSTREGFEAMNRALAARVVAAGAKGATGRG